MTSIFGTVGHSSNLVGLPTEFFASCDFNDQPMPVHISGAREMNDNLFKMLNLASDLAEAGEAFNSYMYAMFGLDPEQRDDKTRAQAQRGRRYRSSFLQLIKGWGIDSNGPEGAVLKGWVESRFGIFPTYHKELISRISSGAWTTYVVEKMSSRFHNNTIYAQLDLVYEFCQWALESMVAPRQSHVTLYRGINAFDEHHIKDQVDKDRIVMRLNNLASFSSDREVACCFGDIILTVEVPLTKLVFFNTLLPMHSLNGEAEYLVIGGDYRVSASHL